MTDSIRAVILITVPARCTGQLVTKLKNIPEVTQAGPVFGEMDVYAMVVAKDAEALKRVVLDQIQNMDEVTSTRTHIMIPQMFWTRESPNS